MEIVAAFVMVGLIWRLHRRIRELENTVHTLDVGGLVRSDRLDVHSMKTGLMTRGQLDAIRSEMPMDASQWDRAALEVERMHLVGDRESNPELH